MHLMITPRMAAWRSSVQILLLPTVSWLWLSVATLAYADESSVLIEGCSVFDPSSSQMLSDRTILIRGDRIVSVTPSDQALEIPNEAIRIDGQGKFALPGLIDAHVHVMHVLDFAAVSGDEVLPLYLAAGVTTVRSTGGHRIVAIRCAASRELSEDLHV
jgi:imidazolonepropionase-like amidohydrolase